MPITDFTPEEITELQAKGIDPALAHKVQTPEQPINNTQAVESTLKAHAGGILGGGAGTIGGLAAASWLLGPEAGIPASVIAGLIGATGGGLAGGTAGQAGQNALQGTDVTQQLEQEQQEASNAHPITTAATDIGASALASGGRPSGDAIKGLSKLIGGALSPGKNPELYGAGFQALINPAIGAGTSVAEGQGLPSGKDLGEQALGGALFSKTWLPHGRFGVPHLNDEPIETTNTEGENTEKTTDEEPVPTTAWTEKTGNEYKIDDNSVKQAWLQKNIKPIGDITDPIQKALARTENNSLRADDNYDKMRQSLHEDELSNIVAKQQESENTEPSSSPTSSSPTSGHGTGDAPAGQLAVPVRANPPTEPTSEVPVLGAGRASSAKVSSSSESPISKTGGLTTEEQAEMKDKDANQYSPLSPAPDKIGVPVALQRDIIQSKATTGSILKHISGLPDHPFASLAKELYENGDAESLNVPWRHDAMLDLNSQNRSHYSIPNDQVNIGTRNLADSRVVMEEAIHSMTSKKIPIFKGTGGDYFHSLHKYLKEGNSQPIKDIIDSYFKVAQHTGTFEKLFIGKATNDSKWISGLAGNADAAYKQLLRHEEPGDGYLGNEPMHGTTGYALGNLHEFIAQAFKDPGFQKVLESIPADDKRNVFQKIIDAVKEMLGLKGKTGSMLESVLRSSGELIKQPRDNATLAGGKLATSNKNDLKFRYDEQAKIMEKTEPFSDEFNNAWAEREKIKNENNGYVPGTEPQISSLSQVPYGHWISPSGEMIPVHNAYGHENVAYEIKHKNKFNGDNTNNSKTLEDNGYARGIYNRAERKYEIEYPKERNARQSKAIKDYAIEHEITAKGYPQKGYGRTEDIHTIEETHSAPPETPEEAKLPPDKYMGKAGLLTRAVLDKVRDIDTPQAKNLADHAQLALNKETELKGQWLNPIAKLGSKLSIQDKVRVKAAFDADLADPSHNHTEMLNNVIQRQFYNLARQKLKESGKQQISIGEPITQAISRNGKTLYVHRDLKQYDNYVPGMSNQKVTNVYRANTDRAEITRLDKVFDDYNRNVHGLSQKDSQIRIQNYKTALQGSPEKANMSNQDWFNARRKSMGTPLPPEFREADPVRNLERYFDRSAIDASHYEFMEKDHKVLAALGQKQDAWGNKVEQDENGGLANNPAIHGLLHQWSDHVRNPADYNEETLSSLVTAAFISGPPLETHKIISNVVKTMSQTANPVTLSRAVIHGLSNITSSYNKAEANGVVRLSSRNIGQMLTGTATATEKMQVLARTIRKISTLGDLTTKVGVGLMQGMNEVIIPSKILRAQQGDITSIKFLKNLDPNFDPSIPLDQKAVERLASIAANYTHGTGDIRSLPAWMLNDSEFSGFFSLAHWSIAQTNNFMKDVYEPALRGEFQPLLVGALGAAMGGYVIKELREMIQGKKSPIPSLQDIAASDKGLSGNTPLVAYNMISAFQYAGFGGLLSQVAKYPFDAVYKNTPQGATFPLDEVASDFAGTAREIATAIANDPNLNWMDVASVATMHILSSNMQLARIAVNQGINNGLISGLPAEKKDLADKMGKLRRFDMVEGLPYNEVDEGSNPYMNLEQKKFKLDEDTQSAMRALPGLVQNILTTYHGSPDIMMQKFKALKENAYSTFPSMQDTPLSFFKYLSYLSREEGPQQANAEFMDYMKHKIINEAKASAVP